MKFRYVIEETSRNGTKNVLTHDYDKEEIIIGRGSACDILIDSTYLSLTHAKFTFTEGRLNVEDLGSLSGTFVNRTNIKNELVKSGDLIKFGDCEVEVFFVGGIWGITERRTEKEKIENEVLVAKDLKSLELSKRMPSMLTLAFLAAIIIATLYFFIPIMQGDKSSWNSGPISNNHRMIATDCKACHGELPFKQVSDSQCLSCHNMSEHSEGLTKHPHSQGRCASCHMEHNGDGGFSGGGLIVRDARMCINCHADVKRVHPDAMMTNVASFEDHPEFSVNVQPALPGASFNRVRLDDLTNLKDNSNIKLNHEVHLKTLKARSGSVKLGCRDCHNPTKDLRGMQPITFEKHCQEGCHTVEFDERLAKREVPHGDPDVVFKFLYAEYAKLLLASEDSRSAQQTFVQRFKPGGGAVAQAQANATATNEDFKRSFVEKESRNAERQLFTKTACYLCHRVVEKEITPEKASISAVSKYEIMKPQIPVHWMKESRFSHLAHEAVKCDDCHQGVYESTKTNQILLPGIKECKNCHSDNGDKSLSGHQTVKSDCIMCHSFHDQELISSNLKRNTLDILRHPGGGN